MYENGCPNCGYETTCLVATAPVGGEGITHCGCFWEGDAEGKDFHCTTEPKFVLEAMRNDDLY